MLQKETILVSPGPITFQLTSRFNSSDKSISQRQAYIKIALTKLILNQNTIIIGQIYEAINKNCKN